MTLTGVSADVAIRRMWNYARTYDVNAREVMASDVLSGHAVSYLATDTFGKVIGRTVVTPENFPVTLVTETNM